MQQIYKNIRFVLLGLVVGFLDLVLAFGFSVSEFSTINYRLQISAPEQRSLFYLQFVIVMGLVGLIIYFFNRKEYSKKILYFITFACIGFLLPIIILMLNMSGGWLHD